MELAEGLVGFVHFFVLCDMGFLKSNSEGLYGKGDHGTEMREQGFLGMLPTCVCLDFLDRS